MCCIHPTVCVECLIFNNNDMLLMFYIMQCWHIIKMYTKRVNYYGIDSMNVWRSLPSAVFSLNVVTTADEPVVSAWKAVEST